MAQLVNVPRWRAFDGAEFPTEAEAKAHEEQHFAVMLCALSREDVDAALDRKPEALALADAIEKAGAIIARKRRESGELRRARNGEGKGSATAGSTAPEHEPSEGQESGVEQTGEVA